MSNSIRGCGHWG